MPASANFYCPGCGNRVVLTGHRNSKNCVKCGVLLRTEEPAKRKAGFVVLLVAIITVLGVVIYLAVK